MSRTYRCTNGSSKRIIDKFRDRAWSWSDDRNKNIDYNDFENSEIALILRIGIQINAPKYFRKCLNKSRKSKDKQILIHAVKNDSFDNMLTGKLVRNANWQYF